MRAPRCRRRGALSRGLVAGLLGVLAGRLRHGPVPPAKDPAGASSTPATR